MLQGGVVMRYQGDDEWFLPKVYHSGAWQYCLPYVFSSDIWKLAGAAGVPMIRFVLETDGDLMVYDDPPFLVRKEKLVNYSQSDILNWIYPVGSIYMSMDSENPTNKFGGTWEQIEGQFLLGVNSAHAVGSSGGAETVSHNHHTTPSVSGGHTLLESQIPSHTHQVNILAYNYASSVTFARNDNNADSLLAQDDKGSGTAAPFITKTYTTQPKGGSTAHTHPIPALSTDSQEINIMPPYTVVYIWKRTA